MGGHDPGPLALPGPEDADETQAQSKELPGIAPQGLPPHGPWGGTQDGTTSLGIPPGSSSQPAGPWSGPAALNDAPAAPGGGPAATGTPASRPFLPDRPPIDLGAATRPDGGAAAPRGKPGGRT